MALNTTYESMGTAFVQQYYLLFDDSTQRNNLIDLYNAGSFMTFEGVRVQGSSEITERFNALGFQYISREISAIDTQPMYDGGILINVSGRLKTDDDPPHSFIQIFVLRPLGNTYFIQHDIFRLLLHDTV